MAHPELVVESLHKSYGQRRVLDGVCLTVPADGRIYGLFGPNGVGKTTLFRCLLGLESYRARAVSWRDRDLMGLSTARIAQIGLGMMFQRPVALEGLTVEQHLGVILEERRGGGAAELVNDVLTQHGLDDLRRSKVAELSFGESKLVDFARVMALGPEVVLLDEPFSGVDPLHVEEIKNRVRAVAEPGRVVLLTDHNLQAALPFVDHAFVLYEGSLLFAGSPADARADARVRGLYLGDDA